MGQFHVHSRHGPITDVCAPPSFFLEYSWSSHVVDGNSIIDFVLNFIPLISAIELKECNKFNITRYVWNRIVGNYFHFLKKYMFCSYLSLR